MMPESFVSIKSFFKDNAGRDFTSLSGLYDDRELLKQTVKELINGKISFDNKRILIKPNWVLHERRVTDKYALYTHPNILIALVDYIVSNYSPESITIGDAPLQDCIWDQLISKEFETEIKEISLKYNIPITIKDFRRVSYNFNKNKLDENKTPISDYLIFNTGKESALEPITTEKTKFRVTNYDPRRMKEAHTIGTHKYCITKDFFDHDIIITVPKIKTHQKAGITGALKILVGINGDKDFLPHHRLGGDKSGGDCYPGKNILRYASELALDLINRLRGMFLFKPLRFSVFAFWKVFLDSPKHNLGAAWHGNDTAWRMVADLNRIAYFGSKDGSIKTTQQREIYSLSDGIIGGQGNGPLNPEPLNMGLIMFSNNSLLNDYTIGQLMRFNSSKIPLVRNIKPEEISNCKFTLNNNDITVKDLKDISISTKPSPGWQTLVEF